MVVAIVSGSRPDAKQRVMDAQPPRSTTKATQVTCPRAITVNHSSRSSEDVCSLGKASQTSPGRPLHSDLILIVRRHRQFSIRMYGKTQRTTNRAQKLP